MRKYITVACVLILLFSRAAALDQEASLKPESLGTCVRCMAFWGTMLVREKDTGRPVMYAGTYVDTDRGEARLVRYDCTQSKPRYYRLPGAKGCYGLAYGDNGKVYAGTVPHAHLYEIDPVTGQVEDLGNPDPAEEFIFNLTKTPDGKIYAGTYPSCKLYQFDPATRRLRDLGRMHAVENYVRDLAAAACGKIYCGLGSHAELVSYDPRSGARKCVLPKAYKSASFVFVKAEGDLVYASPWPSRHVLVFDARRDKLLLDVAPRGNEELAISKPSEGGPVYITGMAEGPMRYDPARRRLIKAGIQMDSAKLCDVERGIRYDLQPSGITAFNTADGKVLNQVRFGAEADGLNTFLVTLGPDGCIYGSSYPVLNLWRYDPQAGKLADLGIGTPGHTGEYNAFGSLDGRLYMVSYTKAVLTLYDPRQPWRPGAQAGANPRVVGPIGDEQYVPKAAVGGSDGRLYIGTGPNYGKSGGAMTIYDPRTDRFEIHRNLVRDQSIFALAEAPGGIMYGGSSLRAINPAAKAAKNLDARLFAWDMRRKKLVKTLSPLKGANVINGLALSPDQTRLYGCVDDAIFIYNLDRQAVTRCERISCGVINRISVGSDGRIYGTAADKVLFRVTPPATESAPLAVETLCRANPYTGAAITPEGDVYFGRESELMVLRGVARKP